jgi:hypothetical protein
LWLKGASLLDCEHSNDPSFAKALEGHSKSLLRLLDFGRAQRTGFEGSDEVKDGFSRRPGAVAISYFGSWKISLPIRATLLFAVSNEELN